jgi:hypothetical protein
MRAVQQSITTKNTSNMTRVRSYSELQIFDTFEERFEYLRLNGQVGRSTFGFDRYINQVFYTSYEWKRARNLTIIRDNGCDLGVSGYDINGEALVHHINPMSVDDIVHGEEWICNPEYLITTTNRTHNAIHFGNNNGLPKVVTVRVPNDTKLW